MNARTITLAGIAMVAVVVACGGSGSDNSGNGDDGGGAELSAAGTVGELIETVGWPDLMVL